MPSVDATLRETIQQVSTIVRREAHIETSSGITPPIHVLNISIAGHFYNDISISNSGGARTTFGNLGEMRKFSSLCFHLRKRRRGGSTSMNLRPRHEILILIVSPAAQALQSKSNSRKTIGAPSSNPAVEPRQPAAAETSIEPDRKSMAEGSAEDTSFSTREPGWFQPGRLFKVALEGDALHLKQFILLGTRNSEGPCLSITTYNDDSQLSEGNFHRSHVQVKAHEQHSGSESSDSRRRTVYLDEYEERDVAENTYIELEYSMNIPFDKFRCQDCGELSRGCLKELQKHYVEWLKYYWDLD